MEKQRDVELAELKEKRKKLEEENAAKKEKERQEREEKAKTEGSTVASDSQQTSGTRNPEGADEADAGESTLNRTIEWSTPRRSTRMEVCFFHS